MAPRGSLAALFALLLTACGDPSVPVPLSDNPGKRPPIDTGPQFICGVVPGSACAREGEELGRCLCSSFEEQIGRVVCCRDGRAIAETCAQASKAVDCAGNPLRPRSDAAAD